jgi:arylsulfatase A-like enzyme
MTLVAVFVACIAATAAEAARPPNVVLIVGDDMGYADLGVQGSRNVVTPNIDAIAADGVRFTNAYVSAPQCSPARAGLLTGRYQERFGHEVNLSPADDRFGLPLTETTIADRLKKAGYATGLVGKWHLGTDPPFHPLRRGFEEFFGFLGGSHPFVRDEHQALLRGTAPVDEPAYLTDAFGREAVGFITAHRSDPFFLYLAFNAVHVPLAVDAKRLEKFAAISDEQRRLYVAALFAMDEAIGRVLGALRETKLLDDTLVVFLNDNGGPTMKGVTVNGAVNLPLRGSKRTTLEGGIRVPLFLRWPAKLPRGRVVEEPVIQLDLVPTILAAAHVPIDPAWKLDGVDLLPHLPDGKAATRPHGALFWRFGPQMAIREGDWKLVRYDLAVEGRPGTSPARLYDLRHDVGETTDLAAREPDRVRALQSAWDRWNAGNVPPLWRGANR